MAETLRDRRVRHARSIIMPDHSLSPLLGETGNLADLRVLVLGGMVTETLCALMHTECLRAETRTPGCRTEAGSADLVLVPHLTRENADRVITQAAHALSQNGRVVIALPVSSSGQGRELVAHTSLMLIGAGFDLPVLRGEGGQRTLCARRGEVASRA